MLNYIILKPQHSLFHVSRKEFYHNTDPVVYEDDDLFYVHATMEAAHQCEIGVTLIPKKFNDASAILEELFPNKNA